MKAPRIAPQQMPHFRIPVESPNSLGMSKTLMKISGLTTPDTVDAAVDAGATHIGLVHFEPSPRHLSIADAAKLRVRVPNANADAIDG